MDRLSLIEILSSIPQEQLLKIIFTLKPPSGIIPLNISQGQQVFALLEWAQSPYGCGLEKVQEVLDTIINHGNQQIDYSEDSRKKAHDQKKHNFEYFRTIEACKNRQDIEQYFEKVLPKLHQQGALEILQNVFDAGVLYNYIARIKDFELGLGMRGEAFFMFAEFDSLSLLTLQQFSAQSMVWAREKVNPDATGQAIFNFRIPTHFCFVIALVDQLDEKTRENIQKTNPFALRVDALWYEIPIVYDLSQQKLDYYTDPQNFFEQFKGEIVWKILRERIKEMLVS